ncbi:MAG: chorismate synthase [Bacillota bacterium]
MLDYKTAGESHGKGLVVITEGIPAGVEIDPERVNQKLVRRQGGYGRGGRMKIESDKVEVISGIRDGKSIGSPIALLIYNNDWENWKEIMSAFPDEIGDEEQISIKKDDKIKQIFKKVTRPRPGHADLAGVIKYNLNDIRNILERASARETAARTAMGGLMDNFLDYFNIDIVSHVIQIGKIKTQSPEIKFEKLKEEVFNSPLHCFDKNKEKEMISYIDQVKKEGDSLGGIIEIRTTPLPVGLGDHVEWKSKLDGKIAKAMMSIPAIKGVEIGPAFSNSTRKGSEVHDEIFYDEEKGYYRETNNAGGLEGGITNGQPLVIRIAMKPIPTLYKPLRSVDIETKKAFQASVERSDVTAVPAAGVVGESMLSFVISQALLEKFGGDNIKEVLRNYKNYRDTYL